MFDSFPTYSRYRTLQLTDPVTKGEDVYALQTALTGCGFDPGPHDGILGKGTAGAVRKAQAAMGLAVDGLAGGNTQQALAMELARNVRDKYAIANGALRGQLEHESGFRLGNYSPLRADGSYDAGVAQRNTAHTPARDGFTVPESIDALGQVVAKHHALFEGLPPRRRWALSQGAWNAPAYACWIAREEGATRVTAGMTKQPGPTARQAFLTYVDSVTTYLSV
jgi:hypothetical protein